ncbi:hypothetical protein NIES4102_38760 [Chondrocystis sp. NIES-4102]|nr:hypothetical protein NIES4102_38760 [Chondrocystis sp. NIES-4102]
MMQAYKKHKSLTKQGINVYYKVIWGQLIPIKYIKPKNPIC